MTKENQNIHSNSQGFIGQYQIIKELGQGGMGKVYQVYDTKLNRQMALKVLLSQDNQTAVKRFLREGEAVAQLHHPNIVKVYGLNFLQNNPYILMEYIEGQVLTDYIKDQQLLLTSKVEIILRVAEAIEYAHTQGILHRDIKPDNIIIDKDGKPYLMDFGLAKLIHVDKSITRTGQILGTPKYMSPEQAAGETRRLDRRSDVYSLGTVMYEVITGESVVPPKPHLINIIDAIVNGNPKLPRDICPDIAIDLEAICMKALSKSLKKRYQTARAMAEDIKHYINGEQVAAPKINPLYKLKYYLLKNRTALSIIAILAVVFVNIWLFLYNPNDRNFSKTPEEQLQYVTMLITQGKFTDAHAQLSAIIAHSPKLETAYVMRAKLFADQRKFNKALRDISEAIEINPLAKYYSIRSEWLSGLNYKDRAITDLKAALKKTSIIKQKKQIHKKLADLLLTRENYLQAIKHYKSLPIKYQNKPQVQINFLKCYYHLQQFATAKEHIAKIVDNSKSSAIQAYAFYYRGLIQIKTPQRALNDLKKAAKLTNKNIEKLYYFLGKLYFEVKDFQNAEKYLVEAQSLFSNDIKTLEILAKCYQTTRQYKKAIAIYTKCIDLRPWEINYYEQRGVCYSQAKDYISSERDYLKCLQISPKHPSALTHFLSNQSKRPLVDQANQIKFFLTILLNWRGQPHSSELELFENKADQLRKMHIENYRSPWKKQQPTNIGIGEFITALLVSDSIEVHKIAYDGLFAVPFAEVMSAISRSKQKYKEQKQLEKLKRIMQKIEKRETRVRQSYYQHLLTRYYIGRDDEALNKMYQDNKWNYKILRILLQQEANCTIRFLAAKALIEIENPRGIQVLQETLRSHHSPTSRLFCFALLNNIGIVTKNHNQINTIFLPIFKIKEPFVRFIAARFIPIEQQQLLQKFLSDQDIRVQMLAARRLWKYGYKPAGALLNNNLSHKNKRFRLFAIKAFWSFRAMRQALPHKKYENLKQYTKKIATKSLPSILEDPYDKIRHFAVVKLTKDKSRSLVPAMKKALDDPSQEVQLAAITALTYQGRFSIVKPLLLDEKYPVLLKMGSMVTMSSEIPRPNLFVLFQKDPFLFSKIMQHWLDSKNPVIKVFAAQILRFHPFLSHKVFRELHNTKSSRHLPVLVSILSIKPPENAEKAILPLLKSPTPGVRRAAAAVLAYILGGKLDRYGIQQLFKNGDKQILEGATYGYNHLFRTLVYSHFIQTRTFFDEGNIKITDFRSGYLQKCLINSLKMEFNKPAVLFLNTTLDRAIQLQPKEPRLYISKSNIAAIIQNYHRANVYAQKAIKLRPSSSVYRYWLAKTYYHTKQYDKALTCIDKHTRVYPFSFEILLLKGKIYRAAKKTKRAQDLFAVARAFDPINYANHLANEKNFSQAIEILQSLPKDHKMGPEVLLYILFCYAQMGQSQKGLAFLKSRKKYCVISAETSYMLNEELLSILQPLQKSITAIYK